jgi:uncharacterized repeat protein (TIGR01451 family)
VCTGDQVVLYHAGVSNITSALSLSPIQVPGSTTWVPRYPQPSLFQVAPGQTGTTAMSGTLLLSTRNVLDITGYVVVTCGGIQTTVPISGMQVLPIADLQITKSIQWPLPYFSGELVTFLINVKNIGSTGAQNVMLKDTRPISTLNFVSSNPGYNNMLPLFTFNLWDILPGQQQTIVMVGSLEPNIAPGTIFTNTATATTTSTQYSTSNDSIAITWKVLTADLSLFSWYATGALPQQSGDAIFFSLRYLNSWPAMSGSRVIDVSWTNISGWTFQDYFPGQQTGNIW